QNQTFVSPFSGQPFYPLAGGFIWHPASLPRLRPPPLTARSGGTPLGVAHLAALLAPLFASLRHKLFSRPLGLGYFRRSGKPFTADRHRAFGHDACPASSPPRSRPEPPGLRSPSVPVSSWRRPAIAA